MYIYIFSYCIYIYVCVCAIFPDHTSMVCFDGAKGSTVHAIGDSCRWRQARGDASGAPVTTSTSASVNTGGIDVLFPLMK